MRKPRVVEVHARLFADDVAHLKKLAAESRLSWQVELRQLVHRALKGEKREVLMINPGKEPK